MSARNTTYTLAAVALLLLAADGAAHWMGDDGPADLPEIVAVTDEAAVKIAWNKGDARIELEKRDGQWVVTAPYEFRADPQVVAAILAPLSDGIEMDVEVDEGPKAQKKYGLMPPDEIRVRVERESGLAADFYIGINSEGGASFVRLPGSEVVYRARIGGRARYDRLPGQWRDQRVWIYEADELSSLRVDLPGASWTAVRSVDVAEDGSAQPGRWRLNENPAFALDQALLDQLAAGLAGWRSLQLMPNDHSAGMDAPMFSLTATRTDGSTQKVQIAQVGASVFAQSDPSEPVYRVQPQIVGVFGNPAVSWLDKKLNDVGASDVVQATLIQSDFVSVLERSGESWAIIEPPNVAANSKLADKLISAVTELRVEAWADIAASAAGLPSDERVVLTTVDGATVVIEIGGPVPGRPEGQEAVFVRNAEQLGRIGVMPARNWPAIRRAWGR